MARARWGLLLLLVWASAAAAQTWPNEPGGATVISDHAFNTALGDGFNVETGVPIVSDATAPLSPPNVLRFTYPIGFPSGSGPGTVSYEGLNLKDLYLGFWWKPSDPWQGQSSGVNKILFISTYAGGSLIPILCGPNGGPYHLCMAPEWKDTWTWLSRNVSDPEVTLGAWHRIEVLAIRSTTTTSADGVVKWWLDGTLVGNHTDVNFDNYATQNWYMVKFNPTWGGGVGEFKTETDYFSFDHVRISSPNAAPSPTVAITGPTTAATYSTNATPLTLSGTASSGTTSVTWANSAGGSGTATGTTAWSIPSIALTAGTNVVTVTAHTASTTGTATLTVSYGSGGGDTTPPTAAITAPSSSATYATTATTITVSGTAADDVGVASVTWASDRGGSGTASGTTSWSVTGVPLLIGPNIVTVTAHDAAGNTGTAVITITRTQASGHSTIIR
jgi:hypothetical protein